MKTQITDQHLVLGTFDQIHAELLHDLKVLIACQGGRGEESIGTDYFVYERMFTQDFLHGLYYEMKWLE